jgi:hypothetical protein
VEECDEAGANTYSRPPSQSRAAFEPSSEDSIDLRGRRRLESSIRNGFNPWPPGTRPMFRITIAKSMALILFIAVALVALSRSSPLWASIVFTATLAAVLTATLGTVARRGRSRLAMAGFALFGWCHLAISFGPWPWLNNDGLRPPALLTKRLTEYVHYKLLNQESNPNPLNVRTTQTWNDATLVLNDPSRYSFRSGKGAFVVISDSPSLQIMHCICSILFGFLGAALSLVVAGRCDEAPHALAGRNNSEDE